MLTPVPKLRETDDASEVGQVIGQDPVPGTLRAPGTAIELVVGQKRPMLQVPDVTGQDRSTAVTTLQGIGLKVSVQQVSSSTAPAGTVVATRPGAGTSVPKGSSVSVDVSGGAPTPTSTASPTPSRDPDSGGGGGSNGGGSAGGQDDGSSQGGSSPTGLLPGLFG